MCVRIESYYPRAEAKKEGEEEEEEQERDGKGQGPWWREKKERNERKKLHQPPQPRRLVSSCLVSSRLSFRGQHRFVVSRCKYGIGAARPRNARKTSPTATFIKDTNEIPAGWRFIRKEYAARNSGRDAR